MYIEGSGPEWYILSMLNSGHTPFWSRTLDIQVKLYGTLSILSVAFFTGTSCVVPVLCVLLICYVEVLNPLNNDFHKITMITNRGYHAPNHTLSPSLSQSTIPLTGLWSPITPQTPTIVTQCRHPSGTYNLQLLLKINVLSGSVRVK